MFVSVVLFVFVSVVLCVFVSVVLCVFVCVILCVFVYDILSFHFCYSCFFLLPSVYYFFILFSKISSIVAYFYLFVYFQNLLSLLFSSFSCLVFRLAFLHVSDTSFFFSSFARRSLLITSYKASLE